MTDGAFNRAVTEGKNGSRPVYFGGADNQEQSDKGRMPDLSKELSIRT
ncbi:MAG: hypothetical protein ACRDLB_03005 [Actinomycetota bacterium]